jgi:hypothetical protein
MPAPTYTEDEAAVHELGHATVACALDLDFKRVFITPMPDPALGWRGQCEPGDAFPEGQRVLQDSFLMGGALMQLALIPGSIAPDQALFNPSLFSNSPAHHADKGAILNRTRWSDDLMVTHMIYTAPNFPHRHLWVGRVGDRPWLLDVETRARAFFDQAEIRAFVNDLRPKLVARKDLPSAEVKERFAHFVPVATVAAFRDPVLAMPNIPSPPIFGSWKA